MTATLPEPAIRQCSLEDVFDASFIELLKLVPANPYVRALILKLTGKMPAEECETFAQLKDWVEFNCVRPVRKLPPVKASPAEEGGIIINVDFTETEYGRADYTVERSGSDIFRIGAEDLMAIIRVAIEGGEGIDDIVETIAGKVDEDAWRECEPNLDNYGDYSYDDQESTDSSDSNTDYSREEIRNHVLRFIREQHPELAAEL